MTIKRKLTNEELDVITKFSQDPSLKRHGYCCPDKRIEGVKEKLDQLNTILKQILGGFYYFGYFSNCGRGFVVQCNYDYDPSKSDDQAGFSGASEVSIKELT